MWENISSMLVIDTNLIGKIFGSLVIFLAAMLAAVIIRIAFIRWQRRMIPILQQDEKYDVYSFETRMTMTRRIITYGIAFFAIILFLLQFEPVRNLGTALLASAGVAGIIIGMAANNTLSNIIAGMIISFSQPVRLHDAVIFDGDFGWIEEIAWMHTVIKTWDNRRIVVPNGILANKVIQNWTLKDASLLGTVMMYVDYYCDVDQVRKWVSEIVKGSRHWSGDAEPGVQVVNFTEKSMVLRAIAKGNDAPSTWDLRCELREKLIKKFKEAKLPLPRFRVESGVHLG
jgi:small-conductance mechanosensitive channel